MNKKIIKLTEEHPDHKDQINDLVMSDPSKKLKYFDWSFRQVLAGFSTQDIIPTVEYFHKNNVKFENKDINSYDNLKTLEDLVKDISANNPSRSEQKGTAEKLYEDDKYVLLYIKDNIASAFYGRDTKWCVTMQDSNYFHQYTEDNYVFYFLIDKLSKNREDPKAKLAYAILRDEKNEITEFKVYNTLDRVIETPSGGVYDEIRKIVEADAVVRPMSMYMQVKHGLLSNEEMYQLFMSLE